MIGTHRSYEHRGVAIDRSHLMPVETPADRRFNHTCYILGSALLIVVMVADRCGVFS